MVINMDGSGKSNTKYRLGLPALFILMLFAGYFVSLQPFQNPLDVLRSFSMSFGAKGDKPQYYLTHTARRSISLEQPRTLADLAAAFEKSGTMQPGERKDSFWYRREGIHDDSGNYVIYMTRTIGGWKISYVKQRNDPPAEPLTLLEPPRPELTVDGKNIPYEIGTYTWFEDGRGICVDIIGLPELIKGLDAVAVSPGSKLIIDFKYEPENLGAELWINKEPVREEVVGNTIILPSSKGIYIFCIHAHWKEGDGSYAFIVEVQ